MYTPVRSESPRVVSRTGVDFEGLGAGGYEFDEAFDLGARGGGGRRDVSGKVAEEGRGGVGVMGRWGAGGLVYRKVSGVV